MPTSPSSAPAPRFLPEGYELAADFEALPNRHPGLASNDLKARGKTVTAEIKCPKKFDSCNDVAVVVTGTKKKSGKKVKVASRDLAQISGADTAKAKLKVSSAGRKLLSSGHNRKVSVKISSNEVVGSSTGKGRILVK